SSTMAANKRHPERGQSILEFLLMLPLMVGLVVIMVRVNTAIQMSIVNQQYARAQALFLAINSPIYPSLGLQQSQLAGKGYNQMVIGVSENSYPLDRDANVPPKASTLNVTRDPRALDGRPQEEPPERAWVRIRDTVTLCTQSVVIGN